jgi:hypothetical protein
MAWVQGGAAPVFGRPHFHWSEPVRVKGKGRPGFAIPQGLHVSQKGKVIIMARVPIPDVLDGGAKIKATWAANPAFTLGEITKDSFTALYDKVAAADAAIESKRHELQGLLDTRDDDARELQDQTSRALSGFRAVFGPDSPQYDQAGGTRRSERAPQKRAAKADAKG